MNIVSAIVRAFSILESTQNTNKMMNIALSVCTLLLFGHGFHGLHCPLFHKCGCIYEMEALFEQ